MEDRPGRLQEDHDDLGRRPLRPDTLPSFGQDVLSFGPPQVSIAIRVVNEEIIIPIDIGKEVLFRHAMIKFRYHSETQFFVFLT